jgi:hypothetical protein
MTGKEVIVGDGDILGEPLCRGAEGHVIVAVGDPRPGDGDIAGIARINAVGVARGSGRHDLDVPGGKVVDRAAGRNVEQRRIAQRDLVQGDIAGAGSI